MTWKRFVNTSRGRWAMVFCAITTLMMVLYMPVYYQEVIGPRPGIVLNDFVLNFFTPLDWSWGVFVILVLAMAQTLFSYYNDPIIFATTLCTYFAVSIVRMWTMYIFTLEPPPGMILLVDPISAYLAYPEKTFAKDLFFSGHVSTMLIMVFVERNKTARWLKVAGTILMAIFLAWQRVHYSVDILFAPVITYVIFKGTERLLGGVEERPLVSQEGQKGPSRP